MNVIDIMKRPAAYASGYENIPGEEQNRAKQLCWEYNRTAPSEQQKRREILQELLGTCHPMTGIEPDFHCDYGFNIHTYGLTVINYNCVILDTSPVNIGAGAFIAPGVCLACSGHAVDPGQRSQGIGTSAPITLELWWKIIQRSGENMFTKRSWESFYSGLIMVGLVFMVFPVIYFCGATKEKQILPPLIMFLLGLVIFVISVHFSVKYHKEKTKYTRYKIDKSLTYTFTLTYGDKVETVTDFSQIEYAIKWLAKYRTGHVEIAVTPTMGSLKKFYICYTDKDPYIHMLIEQEREDGVGYWEERGNSYKIPIMTLERLYVKHKMISFDYLNRRETGVDAREGLIL